MIYYKNNENKKSIIYYTSLKDALNIQKSMKKRVIMTLYEYNQFGGHGSTVTNLCKSLANEGYECSIGAFKFKQDPPSPIKKITLNYKNFVFKANEFDIVHNHQPKFNYFALFIKKPFIFHLHGASNRIQEINLKLSLAVSQRKIDHIISISKSVLYQINIIKNKIPFTVIHCGVNSKYFKPQSEKQFVRGNPQLLFVGVLYTHKNVNKLIEFIKNMTVHYQNIHLQIVGEGIEFNRLKKQIEDGRMQKHVELTGNISNEELKNRFSSCDMYVTASNHEMLDMPAIEAMSTNKPVLLSNLPAHNELIEKSKGGLLFDPEDFEDFYKKFKRILEEKQQFTENGRKFAEENDWTNISKKVVMIYNELS